MTTATPTTTATTEAAVTVATEMIAVERIHAAANVRRGTPPNIPSLAASIRREGVLTAITVDRRDDGDYDVVAGFRRLAAAKLPVSRPSPPSSAPAPGPDFPGASSPWGEYRPRGVARPRLGGSHAAVDGPGRGGGGRRLDGAHHPQYRPRLGRPSQTAAQGPQPHRMGVDYARRWWVTDEDGNMVDDQAVVGYRSEEAALDQIDELLSRDGEAVDQAACHHEGF